MEEYRYRDMIIRSILWLLFAALIIFGIIFIIGIFDDDTDTDLTGPNNSEVIELGSDTDRLSRIMDNPEAFYGTRTIVEGEIQDVYNERIFSISDQTIGDELLIATKHPLTDRQIDEGEELFEDNADVQVIGEVRQFVEAELRNDFDLDFTDDLALQFDSRPVMVGELIQYSDEDVLFDFNQGIQEDE